MPAPTPEYLARATTFPNNSLTGRTSVRVFEESHLTTVNVRLKVGRGRSIEEIVMPGQHSIFCAGQTAATEVVALAMVVPSAPNFSEAIAKPRSFLRGNSWRFA
ncbi:hypothetical protein [Oceanicola sp. 22II-s10i]|uniref:hypothetical protein n=1 Tax=Oceanicola sp. 22II-s10i TaxID=1317116 RepID=UPI0011319FBD|nr:hypothetical protein [Oceanicola sp. 22II-s10i]